MEERGGGATTAATPLGERKVPSARPPSSDAGDGDGRGTRKRPPSLWMYAQQPSVVSVAYLRRAGTAAVSWRTWQVEERNPGWPRQRNSVTIPDARGATPAGQLSTGHARLMVLLTRPLPRNTFLLLLAGNRTLIHPAPASSPRARPRVASRTTADDNTEAARPSSLPSP